MFRKILIVALLALPVAGICKQRNNKKSKEAKTEQKKAVDETDYKRIGAPMPVIRAIMEDKTVLTNNDLKGEGNVLLMLFNPTCEHCMDMTTLVQKNMFLFKKTKIMLLSGANMMPYLSYFKNTVHTEEFPSIKIAVDSAKTIDVLFNYITLPQINFYGPDHKLLKTFNGDVPIDSLKNYIN